MCCKDNSPWFTGFKLSNGAIVSMTEQGALDLLAKDEASLQPMHVEVVRMLRARRPAQGLGDTLATVSRAFGVRPCGGCKERQKKLNELFPYGRTE